ncbi:MAG TPA: hypothetical protein VFB20_15640 [Burkholderiales bacterium]|nr:hypothetical protein [Burkholderiales bacterium]
MSNPNTKPSNRAIVQAVLDPVSQGAATVTTGWVPMSTYDSILAMLMVGALGASATVDAKLQQAQDSSGTGAKDITGKSITQLTKAGSDDNKQVLVNCRADELDVNNAFTHVRLSVTVGTAASLIAACVFGLDARYQPGTHKTTVDEVVG